MREFTDLQSWRAIRKNIQGAVGFVPTMGALHTGHASLLERARAENEHVVLSIYVNPTQFNNPEDLRRYPKTLESDREIAARAGVDSLLVPTYEQIYPDGYRYKVSEAGFSSQLCGAHRPGHFDGVLTVVLKLLNLVQADRAYFGEKDFQQLQLIKGMVDAFFISTEIVPCATVRESDGLAMSSRNLNLTSEARALAPLLYKTLVGSVSPADGRSTLEKNGFTVDYFEEIGDRRYVAATVGGVRLIDNAKR